MMGRHYQCQLFITALIAASALLTGCQLAASPTASVLPHMATETSLAPTLSSALIRYETYEAGGNPAGSAESSYGGSDAIALASFNQLSDGGMSRLLAVRYPHPNGRLDVARVELVFGDAHVDPQAQSASWHRRITRFIRETTPGVAWGDGVKQAKALDIKLSELQIALGHLEAYNGESIQRADERASLRIEVNGEAVKLDGVRPEQLETLAKRVVQYGKLITIRSTASELFGDDRMAPGIRRTKTRAPTELVALPEVDDEALSTGVETRAMPRRPQIPESSIAASH